MSRKKNNRQKQREQNAQRRFNTFISQGQQTRKRKKAKNAQKQQKNTAKTKARNKAVKTAALFVLAKLLQAGEKYSEHAKRQKKIFSTKSALRSCRKSPKGPQKGKTIQRGRPTSPIVSQASLPTKNFGFNLKKN